MEMTSLADLLDVQELDFRSIVSSPGASPSPSSMPTRTPTSANRISRVRDPDCGRELKTLELEFDKSEGELQMLEAKRPSMRPGCLPAG